MKAIIYTCHEHNDRLHIIIISKPKKEADEEFNAYLAKNKHLKFSSYSSEEVDLNTLTHIC